MHIGNSRTHDNDNWDVYRSLSRQSLSSDSQVCIDARWGHCVSNLFSNNFFFQSLLFNDEEINFTYNPSYFKRLDRHMSVGGLQDMPDLRRPQSNKVI